MGTSDKKNTSDKLIDPIYEQFSRSIMRTLDSTEFYEYFMDFVARGRNEFQFSNRRLEKIVDLSWVDAIDEALEGFQNIINNPRNIIREEEIIVNVANAKKAGPDVVRHLAQHGAMVEDFDEETGNVRPSKLMQKIREDSTELYENRLVFTVLEHAFHFVQIRHSALSNAMSEEQGAKLKVTSDLENMTEKIHMDMFLHIAERDDILKTDEKNEEVFNRISRIYRVLGTFMNSQFAEQMKKINRIKGNVTKTNVLKKNPDYKKIVKLWEFLRSYGDVGYMIKVTEQSPVIDERFQQDIYHNIMFQYIILKNYLEEERDREVPAPLKSRKRKLKPKMIRQIIEELTEDYDLPDIEIRKVLIEELTKEQLMLEEEAERRRLVEEQEERRKAEEEARKAEEEERQLAEEAKEQARIQQEIEEQLAKEQMAIMEIKLEDRRRTGLFLAEIELLQKTMLSRQTARGEEAEKIEALMQPLEDFAGEAARVEAEEQSKLEAEERARLRQIEDEARRQRALEEEQERIRQAEIAAQIALDLEHLALYLEEVSYFNQKLEEQVLARKEYEENQSAAITQMKLEQTMRRAQRQDPKPGNKRRFGGK